MNALLPSHIGKTVRYDGHRYTVECVRLTWRRILSPVVERGLRPCVVTATVALGLAPVEAPPDAGCLWVSALDVAWEDTP